MNIYTQQHKIHNKKLPDMKISRNIPPIRRIKINLGMHQIMELVGMDIKTVNVMIFNMFKEANGRLRIVSSKTKDIKNPREENSNVWYKNATNIINNVLNISEKK